MDFFKYYSINGVVSILRRNNSYMAILSFIMAMIIFIVFSIVLLTAELDLEGPFTQLSSLWPLAILFILNTIYMGIIFFLGLCRYKRALAEPN